ncbi:hypothetical protein EYE40_05670 [Glaciihabitans arcticus]|uniref:SHOCT domain-containing protein n=1 Tax=Glaciihabitans arcticus TaxID=2668039 RepID=A0A4Q9GTG9_9MICO|nr:hypothetical protein [Glaciihabitans arcticus]TBN56928.1 hypothetical protein EYE40_05670 [Glaciihabitans arcticus]
MLTTLALAPIAAHAGPWAAGFGWVFLLIPLFWIALFALFFAFVGRRFRRGGFGPGYGGGWHNPAREAEATLAGRYAGGDIDEKEYAARLAVLRANNSHDPSSRR